MRKPTRLEYETYHDCQDFCLHDYPNLAKNYHINEREFNQMFQTIKEIKVGGRIAYMDLKGTILHFGLCTNRDTIVSKNGLGGKIYEHSVEDSGWARRPFGIIAVYLIPFQLGFNEEVRRFLDKA